MSDKTARFEQVAEALRRAADDDRKRRIAMIKEVMDSVTINTCPSGLLRHENGGLPYSECEVLDVVSSDPFFCITVNYWPNGKSA
jgi:hypothetical protein